MTAPQTTSVPNPDGPYLLMAALCEASEESPRGSVNVIGIRHSMEMPETGPLVIPGFLACMFSRRGTTVTQFTVSIDLMLPDRTMREVLAPETIAFEGTLPAVRWSFQWNGRVSVGPGPHFILLGVNGFLASLIPLRVAAHGHLVDYLH